MDIRLNVESPEYSLKPACILVIEPELLGVVPKGDMAWLTTQAHIKRGAHWDQMNASFYPLLVDLQGVVCSESLLPPMGMVLHSPQEMPISLAGSNEEHLVTLTFPFPLSFIQQLEEERSAQQGLQDLRLRVRFWAHLATTWGAHSGHSFVGFGIREAAVLAPRSSPGCDALGMAAAA